MAILVVYLAAGSIAYAALGLEGYARRLMDFRRAWAVMRLLPYTLPAVVLWYRFNTRRAGGRVVGFRRGWTAAWEDARAGALSGARLLQMGLTILGAQLFFSSFAAWKMLIPRLHPFRLDLTFAQIDAFLHGGAPHRLLAWVPLGAIDRLYTIGWLGMVLCVVVWLAWSGDTTVLLQLLITWLALGTVVALLASSAGPIFFQAIVGDPNPYQHLMERVGSEADNTMASRAVLWRTYQTGHFSIGSGISAFPSIHVAMPAMLTLIAWGRARWLAVAFGVFTAVILVGSVALGWHYAVDGYASLIGVGLIWRLSRGCKSLNLGRVASTPCPPQRGE